MKTLPFTRTLLCLVLGFLTTGIASATTYFFSSSGLDSNDGADSAHPKQTLAVAMSLLSTGNTILFKRGDSWYVPNFTWEMIGKSNVVLDAYGAGPAPIISNMELLAGRAEWTAVAAGRWSRATSIGSRIAACFVSGKSLLQVSSASQVDDPSKYCVLAEGPGHAVHIFSQNGPPEHVELLAAEDGGGGPLFRATRLANVAIRNIDFRGGVWMGLHFIAPTSGVLIERCRITRMRSYGIVFQKSDDTSVHHDAPRIQDCYINKVWSSVENTRKSPPGDGVFLEGAVESAVVRGNTIVDAGHTGISLHGMSTSHRGVNNSIIEQNEIYGLHSNYLHAISLAGYDMKCSHNIVRRNYAHDYKVTCHLMGDNNMIYANVFRNVDVSETKGKQGWAVDWMPWKVKGGEAVACHNNKFVHNTIYDCEENPIMVGQFAPAALGSGNLIANNLIVKWNATDSSGRPNFGVKVLNDLLHVPSIQCNGFWNSDPTGKVILLGGVAYTASEYANGNRQQAPRFVNEGGLRANDYRLRDQSPYIKGGMTIPDMDRGFADYDGHPWDPDSPSIGAFQFRESN